MSTADDCRARGWKPGDVVEGPDSFGDPNRVRITAIGERQVLAVDLKYGPKYGTGHEDAWAISWANWNKVGEAKS